MPQNTMLKDVREAALEAQRDLLAASPSARLFSKHRQLGENQDIHQTHKPLVGALKGVGMGILACVGLVLVLGVAGFVGLRLPDMAVNIGEVAIIALGGFRGFRAASNERQRWYAVESDLAAMRNLLA